MNAFGHLPKRNEVTEMGEYRFRVLNADSRRVHLLRLTPLATAPSPARRRHGQRAATSGQREFLAHPCFQYPCPPDFPDQGRTMRWITHPGWPGNLLAMAGGATTTLALAPFDIWPLALLAIAIFYLGLRELNPRQALLRGWCYGLGLFLAGTSWVYVSIHDYGAASPALAAFLDLRILCRDRTVLRPAGLAVGTLAAPQRCTAERRAGLRRPVAGSGSLPRLVPHRLPLALCRLQPAIRHRWPGWRRSAACG